MKLHANRALAGSVLLCLALAGCNRSNDAASGTDAVAGGSAATESAVGPEAKPGLSASEGRLVLPIVEGRPGVAYFKVANSDTAGATIASVYIGGVEKAEMHRTVGGKMEAAVTVDVPPGQVIEFAPGGLHVMAFGVSESLEEGGTTELTLTFSDGDKLSIPISIEAVGGAAAVPQHDHASMEGMQH